MARSEQEVARTVGRHENENKWEAPTTGCLKINVDASLVGGQDYYSIGMVLRNHLGHYLLGRTSRSTGSLSVLEAEVAGLEEAMSCVI